jgi:spore coat polysaccharide biosynthesis protein SpsF
MTHADRTVAVIQARMGSTRLPGKVLLPLLGQPMLVHVVERSARANLVDEVVIATTTDPADEPIVALASTMGWLLERGDPVDLLDRYVQVARARDADVVVRITSDCPLIDPGVIDRTIEAFRSQPCDYASNFLERRTFPRGLDTEVISRSALERAWRDDVDPAWREHVTPFIYRNPALFRLVAVSNAVDESHHRWSVDTADDYDLVGRIYAALGRSDFTWRDALALVEAYPDWGRLNRGVRQKSVPPRRPL